DRRRFHACNGHASCCPETQCSRRTSPAASLTNRPGFDRPDLSHRPQLACP
ncbi:MAG: hypothetical protein DME56_02815, partial [Verrucomicrobia bacterium]